ncbi:SRPBCC family protein [Pseudomonas sp. NPDC089743]|uniref:SRPBCC family protein n=1 Tax=Pseudomonas sp. NPDC089743 TaxID=3364471 RepID=UPI003807FD27
MIRAEYSCLLPVDQHQLFAYISDPSNDVHWQGSCVEAQLASSPARLGTEYTIVFSFLGRRMNFRCRITTFEPPHNFGFKVLEGSFLYEGRYSFTAQGEGTRLDWQFDVEPGRFFGILPISLLRKVLISQIEKDFIRAGQLVAMQSPNKEWAHD